MAWRSPSVFYVVFAVVTAGCHYYLYTQLVRRTGLTERGRRWGIALLALGWCALNFARPLTLRLTGATASTAAVIAWVWFGVAVYLGLSLLVLHLLRTGVAIGRRLRRTPEPDLERRIFLARTAAGLSVGASALMSSYGVFRAFEPAELSEVPVKLPRLPRALDGFTIVQISDVHVGDIIGKGFLEHVVERVNALKPDLVAITGDLVDGSVRELGPTIATLQGLRSRHGTFFITGNHEYYVGANAWCDALAKMGMTVLRNRTVSVGEKGASFDLVGVDDWGERQWGKKSGYDFPKAIAGRDPQRAAVLLAHQPANFDVCAKAGMGLQLSGHTHGGQMFPFTRAVGLIFDHPRGRFDLGDSTLYVCRGTGFWGAPMRVDSPPEIVKVTLLA